MPCFSYGIYTWMQYSKIDFRGIHSKSHVVHKDHNRYNPHQTVIIFIFKKSLNLRPFFLFYNSVTFNGMVWYSSIYIAPLNSRGPTEALLVRLVYANLFCC